MINKEFVLKAYKIVNVYQTARVSRIINLYIYIYNYSFKDINHSMRYMVILQVPKNYNYCTIKLV